MRTINNFSNYYLLDNLDVFSKLTNKILRYSKNNAGYLCIRLTNDNGKRITFGKHRLVYMVLNNLTLEDMDDLVINHKDGNKLNNNILNLELCTQKYNIEHAGLNNLTDKCLPIYVKDFKDNNIKLYMSATECAKALGYISKDTVLFRLKHEDKIFNDGKQYVLKNNIHKLHKTLNKKFYFKPKYMVKDLLTKNVYKFNTIKDLSNFISISFSLAYKLITTKTQPLLTFQYQFKLDDGSEWLVYKDLIRSYVDLHKLIPIKVEYKNNIYIFFNLKDCSKFTGINITTIHYRLKNNLQNTKNIYKISYY